MNKIKICRLIKWDRHNAQNSWSGLDDVERLDYYDKQECNKNWQLSEMVNSMKMMEMM